MQELNLPFPVKFTGDKLIIHVALNYLQYVYWLSADK